jgi:NAD(P)-dependent dehydrogenase (short-subunit alcohol dehydrogenase family)
MVETELMRNIHAAWQRQEPATNTLGYEEWASDKIRRVVPLGRWQTPEDIAAMAVFLSSPLAANITGQTINVDGGYVMR